MSKLLKILKTDASQQIYSIYNLQTNFILKIVYISNKLIQVILHLP